MLGPWGSGYRGSEASCLMDRQKLWEEGHVADQLCSHVLVGQQLRPRNRLSELALICCVDLFHDSRCFSSATA